MLDSNDIGISSSLWVLFYADGASSNPTGAWVGPFLRKHKAGDRMSVFSDDSIPGAVKAYLEIEDADQLQRLCEHDIIST